MILNISRIQMIWLKQVNNWSKSSLIFYHKVKIIEIQFVHNESFRFYKSALLSNILEIFL